MAQEHALAQVQDTKILQDSEKREIEIQKSLLPKSSPGSSFSAYLSMVSSIPVLSKEEERGYLIRSQEGDLEAVRMLVLSNLRFVVFYSRRFLGYGLAHEELIQEGTVGLMKAIKRFNLESEVRLISFAVHWIKEEIHEYVIKNWRLLKIATTKPQRKLFFNLRRMKKSIHLADDEASVIAKSLDVPLRDVHEMNRRLTSPELSLDTSLDYEGGSSTISLSSPESDNPEIHFASESEVAGKREVLHQAMVSLDERSRDILESRFLIEPKATLGSLSSRYNVSIERVRQIEKKALLFLKSSMLPKFD